MKFDFIYFVEINIFKGFTAAIAELITIYKSSYCKLTFEWTE